MNATEDVKLLFVGREGGCLIIWRIVRGGDYIRAYSRSLSEPAVLRASYFYARSEEYNPEWPVIDPKIKDHLEGLGIPIEQGADRYKIPLIRYKSQRAGDPYEVVPFQNNDKIYYLLRNPNQLEIIVTPTRLTNRYIGLKDDVPFVKASDDQIRSILGIS